jgi:mercuric reductase
MPKAGKLKRLFMKAFDFVIVGGGAAGFAAAIKADELGAKTAMINAGLPLGGTCVNVGCVPSKAMLYPGEILHLFAKHNIKGIPPCDLSKNGQNFSFHDLIEEELSIVATARMEKYIHVLQQLSHVSFIEGMGRFVSPHELEVNGTILKGEKFLIATGSKAEPPLIDGIKEAGFLTHVEALSLSQQPRSLLVLGSGPVGLEFAQMFARLGTKVVLVSRRERILPNGEPELAEKLEEIFQEEGIEILHNAIVLKANKVDGKKKIVLSIQGEIREIFGDEILVATGKIPNTKGLGLEDIGVALDAKKAIVTQPTLETSLSHIFAAGDVASLPMRLETTAGKEGTLAASNALAATKLSINYRSVPGTIFTDPQYAYVGLTDEEAQKQGYACACRVVDFGKVPKAAILRRKDGVVKMVVDASSQEILGVHVLAPHAAEFIFAGALAIQNKMTLEKFLEALPVFPTLSESLKIAAQAFVTDLGKLSCCT